MSSTTKYFCDICGKEIPQKEVRSIWVHFITSIAHEELDICDKCYCKVTENMGVVPASEYDKKRLADIIKAWLKNFKKR